MTLERFFSHLPFPPDEFQLEAARAIEAGESVVVTAPTGAGKTLVAEVATHLALERGRRAYYTTPLKALSNQKYGDFVAHYGAARVGLLTGDNVINGDAEVVVMTTEVLRNMIYARDRSIGDLGVVVLDEVHYLQDPFRGAVWEEIIIHLPRSVQLLALSATVSNATEFSDWVRSRRGLTRLVLERHRPVPLESSYMVKDRHGERRALLFPTFVDHQGRREPNPAVERLLSRRRHRRFATPRRSEVVELLERGGMLPAIYFLFSRAGCEAAAQQLMADGVRLTTAAERERIRQYAELRTRHLDPADLEVLGYGRWVSQLEDGVAPHHAGMVPAFKETVEELFSRGLVKLVFATETLALGINMPARSVVLESLTKFTGESHELLQPGDYTQLTGRAGRRGIDKLGYGVVLYSPYLPFDRVADIAAAGSHPLRSGFRPTYNMAVNLVANYPRPEAEELLNASFAQFQREAGMGRLRRSIERNQEALAGYSRAAECELGDIWEYLAASEPGRRMPSHRRLMQEFARHTQAGDVLEVPAGRRSGRYVMLARGRTAEPRLLLLGSEGDLARVRLDELPLGTAKMGSIALPSPFEPAAPRFRESVASLLREYRAGEPELVAGEEGAPAPHPVALCPELADHLRWARRAQRMVKEVERLRERLDRSAEGLVAEFRSILELLEAWGYTSGWTLTRRGENLRFIYNELDLLLAEAVHADLLAGLSAPELAALASAFVYEPRSGGELGGWPTPTLEERGGELESIWRRLQRAEADRLIPETRPPEPGFAGLAYRWASGEELDGLLGDDELAAGDFVRNCRQLLDLLRQLRDTFPDLAATADASAKAVDRGVVAAGGII